MPKIYCKSIATNLAPSNLLDVSEGSGLCQQGAPPEARAGAFAYAYSLRVRQNRLMIGRTMELISFLRGLPGGQALDSAKDRLLAKGAKAHFNKLIGRYGTVLDFQLNTVDRSLSFTLLLKGEETSIEIHVHEYTLSIAEGKSVLVIDGTKINTSRDWVTELIRDKVGQKRLVVPDHLEWVVQLLR